MGNNESSLREYNIGQPFSSNKDHPQKIIISPATHKVNEERFTVFEYRKEHSDLKLAEKNIEILCTVRHPYILKYVTCFNTSTSKFLITEHALPLDVAVENQDIEEILLGIHNILEALIFLHEKGLVCHNDLTVSSIFVTGEGIWKLACFHNATKVRKAVGVTSKKFKDVYYKKSKWEKIREILKQKAIKSVLRLSKQSYNQDVKGFAEFALSVLEYLQEDSEVTKRFMKRLETNFLGENASSPVATLSDLVSDPIFDFPYHNIMKSIQDLALKSPQEKHFFFSQLGKQLLNFSPQLLSRRLIPKLFSTMLLTDQSAEPLLPYLFASGNDHCKEKGYTPLLEEELFKKCSLPKILKLFKCHDVGIRLILLKHLPLYIDAINRITLTEDIMQDILLGLKDENEDIVVETFKGLAVIVPLLGANVVVGQNQQKIFYDRKPDFSRSCKEGDELSKRSKPVTSVTDVIKALSVEKETSENLNNPANNENTSRNIMEEKQRKRKEREKQREEQRLKREERKKEREAAKLAKLASANNSIEVLDNQNISSGNSASSDELSGRIPSQEDSTQETNITDIHDSSPYYEDTKQNNSSDQEWEGFEAFSNSSDSEHAEKQIFDKYKHSFDTIINETPLQSGRVNSDGEDVSGWGWEDTDNHSHAETYTNPKDEAHVDIPSVNNEIVVADNYELNSHSTVNSIDLNKKETMVNKTGKLSLTSSKKIIASSIKSTKDNQKLGDEFDIVISAKTVSEPDYFADMMPSVEKPKEIETKQTLVSSKFDASSPTEVGGDGWDDEGDEWNDF